GAPARCPIGPRQGHILGDGLGVTLESIGLLTETLLLLLRARTAETELGDGAAAQARDESLVPQEEVIARGRRRFPLLHPDLQDRSLLRLERASKSVGSPRHIADRRHGRTLVCAGKDNPAAG